MTKTGKGGLISFSVFLLVTLAGLFLPLHGPASADTTTGPGSEVVILSDSKGAIKRHSFEVEVVDTPKSRAKGLMYRQYLAPEHGMLFVFDQVRDQSFWMQNTYIPLDMIFIKENGEIRHIHHHAKPHDETHIHSRGPVKAVLEINAGISRELGIRPGDKVRHKVFELQ